MAGGSGKRKEGGGGGGDRGGKKQRNYGASWRKADIPINSQGFLVSCDTGREGKAKHEALSLLNEYYEQLKPAQAAGDAAEAGDAAAAPSKSIDELLASEVADLKSKKGAVFSVAETGIGGLLYVTMAKDAGVTPLAVATAIMEDIAKTQQSKTRLCMRFLPVDTVCQADLPTISRVGGQLLPPHFPTGEGVEPIPFAVHYEHRASKSLDRMAVINALVEHVPQPPHKVNLDAPRKTVVVQLIKTLCLMGVVERYKELCRFNVRTLCIPPEEREAERAKQAAAAKAGAGKAAAGGKEGEGAAAAADEAGGDAGVAAAEGGGEAEAAGGEDGTTAAQELAEEGAAGAGAEAAPEATAEAAA